MPVLLCLLSILTFPDVYAGQRYDYREYYYRNCRWILGLVALTVAMVSINEYVLLEQPLLQFKNLMRGAVVIVLLASAVWRNPLFHGVVIGAVYLMMGGFILNYRAVIA